MSHIPGMTSCPNGAPGVHVDLGKLTADVAAALQEARNEGVKRGREEAAELIRAHADEHAPTDGNIQQRRMRRHLLIAARVAAPKPTLTEVAEALKSGNYTACYLDEAGRPTPPGGAA